jgi:hypothetical protein
MAEKEGEAFGVLRFAQHDRRKRGRVFGMLRFTQHDRKKRGAAESLVSPRA